MQGLKVIRIGIIGCNYGSQVLLPAFRLDSRCEVVAIAGSRQDRAGEAARQHKIAHAFADWKQMIDTVNPDAIAIATPPMIQPDIAIASLRKGIAVFAEKPMSADLAAAGEMVRAAQGAPTMVDFGFTEIPEWRRAKAMLDAGDVGRLRHVAISWHIENVATRKRLRHWKTDIDSGGGALGNLSSHSMHYLEWFCGPIAGMSARVSGLPDDPAFQTNVTMSLEFASGASGSYSLSCAAFGGSGHRLEFCGEDGTLILENPTVEYMRGFTLTRASRPAGVTSRIDVAADPVSAQFPDEARIAPVARLVGRFLDAVETGKPTSKPIGKLCAPNFTDGYRAQVLLDAIRRSHDSGRWLDVNPGRPL